MSSVINREFVTTSERESERERERARASERKAWGGCLFSAISVSPALFHTVDRQPFLSPHSAPHHPISVYLHKDSYCPAGDRPLTCSICTAPLVISEGHANSTARRSAGVWEGWWGTEGMEEGREIKGMNSRWAFWGIAALLRLARLATGRRRKACPLSILVIQELVDRLYQII